MPHGGAFATDGFTLERAVLDEATRARLLRLTDPQHSGKGVHHPSGVVYAARGLLWNVPGLAAELATCGVDNVARAAMGHAVFPIDATFFDKQPSANWTVPGHQDRVLPVADPGSLPSWTRKGVTYIEPSAATLAGLVALRIHFDACTSRTGALAMVAGSHLRGVCGEQEIRAIPLDEYRVCEADVGDVLVIRPLILHRSSPSLGNGRRRVLHVVYASDHRPAGVRWRVP